MRQTRFWDVAMLVVLASCSGLSQSPVTPSTPWQSGARPEDSFHAFSISGDAKTSLLYVSCCESPTVDIFSWPAGLRQSSLTVNALGLCVDEYGDVYVPSGSVIYEYAPGGSSPIETLTDVYGDATACSIDRLSGNLAVTDSPRSGSGNGNLLVYLPTSTSPAVYTASGFYYYWFPAYDDKGNLFVNGQGNPYGGLLAELPKRRNSLETIALNTAIQFPGGLMWDGEYLAYGDQHSGTIDQFAISGRSATEVGSTPVGGLGADPIQFWITGTRRGAQGTGVVVAENGAASGYGAVEAFNYPAGGNPTQIIGGFYGVFGVTISVSTAIHCACKRKNVW